MKLHSRSWQQNGSISLWRYTENERNYPGWHLTADMSGCASLVALLDALLNDGIEASRVIKISAPTPTILQVPNNRGGQAGWRSPERLRVTYSKTQSFWAFPKQLGSAELTIGADWLVRMRDAVTGIPQGQGDYSIGADEHDNLPLWFWWQPAAA